MLSIPLAPPPGFGRAARAGPEIALETAVLEPETQAPFGAAVKVVPVARGEFLDILVLVAAVGGSGRTEARATAAISSCRAGAGQWFDIATGHVGLAASRSPLCQVVAVDIVAAVVEVEHQARSGVDFQVLSAEKAFNGSISPSGRRVMSAMVEEP